MPPHARNDRKQVLDYIIRFLERRGYIPTYAQIAQHLGVKSRATVAKHIKALERLGLITIRDENGSFRHQSCRIGTGAASRRPAFVPELLCEVARGRIAAGQPIEVVEDDETISVPRFMLGRVRPEQVYALRIKGDSMIDEHICDGDIALIETSHRSSRWRDCGGALVDENSRHLETTLPARRGS